MNQKYYKIRQPSEAKSIGVKDGGSQAEFLKEGFNDKLLFDKIMEFKSIKNQSNSGNFPDFDLNLEYVKMRKNAMLTDFISFYPHIPFAEYIVSDKVQHILSTFNLSSHRFYPVTIDFHGSIIKDYKLLFIKPLEVLDIADVTKSLFFDGFEIAPTSFITFNSIEEYANHTANNYTKEKKLHLTKAFDENLDYFKLRGSESYISNDLKETFEIAGVTGIKFVDAIEPELHFED